MAIHELYIERSVLFYGSEDFKDVLSVEEINNLLDKEFIDWLSSLYWGEGLGIEYALKMHQMSEDEDSRKEWLETYKQELDHQQRILKWMLDNSMHPVEPSLMIKSSKRVLESGRSAKFFKDYTKVIRLGQIFLEEMGVNIIRWRLPGIKNKSLRAILYKITLDEAHHISSGKRILNKYENYTMSRADNFQANADKVFPLHIAKNLISESKFKSIRSIAKESVQKRSSEILNAKIYKPIEILEKFLHVEGYECYACHPTKSEGLLLEPVFENNEISDTINLGNHFVGMDGLVHGGFISMALDEIMGYAITLGMKRFSLTTKLNVKFLNPMKCNMDYLITSKVESVEGSRVKTTGIIRHKKTNETIASAEGEFYIVDKKLGNKLFPQIINSPQISNMFS